jgi:hypothetical protein
MERVCTWPYVCGIFRTGFGAIANRRQALSRRILRGHALEFIAEYVRGPRISRALRVIACRRALMAAYGKAGYPISRAQLDFQEGAMARSETFPRYAPPLSGRSPPMVSFLRVITASAETEWGGAVSVSCGRQGSEPFGLQCDQFSAPGLIELIELW